MKGIGVSYTCVNSAISVDTTWLGYGLFLAPYRGAMCSPVEGDLKYLQAECSAS